MVVLDFSGKRDEATLAMSFEAFLSNIAQVERLRPHTVRAYRYELAAAATDPRFVDRSMTFASKTWMPG